jgi:hypothetical protein
MGEHAGDPGRRLGDRLERRRGSTSITSCTSRAKRCARCGTAGTTRPWRWPRGRGAGRHRVRL